MAAAYRSRIEYIKKEYQLSSPGALAHAEKAASNHYEERILACAPDLLT
jgi:hypothetical protein